MANTTQYVHADYSQLDKNDSEYPEQLKALVLSELALVEGGEFSMGSDAPGARNREKPVHNVTLDDFYIGKTEVTQQLFEHIMDWNYSYFECDTCPLNNISWKQGLEFMTKINEITGLALTFPSEAQWEFAAKGGNLSKGYVYSGSNDINDVAWNAGNAQGKVQSTARLKPNELGLYDMTGNVWEFCLDDMNRNAYKHPKTRNPVNRMSNDETKTKMKVIRGGGHEFPANESEVYKRDGATSNVRMPDIGMRFTINTSSIDTAK